MKLEELTDIAVSETRMQMLGTQVLFGFQVQATFQDTFESWPETTRIAEVLALTFIILSLGLLIAVACQHRIVEEGRATRRILFQAHRYARWADFLFSGTVAFDVYLVSVRQYDEISAVLLAVVALVAGLAILYGLGVCLRYRVPPGENRMTDELDTDTSLHAKIEQMLTESRVVLPGAQALLGFQFLATLTKAFEGMPWYLRNVHFAGLAAVALCTILLISPAAVHRLTFKEQDVERFHRIGSILIGVALVPLLVGICADVYVAMVRICASGLAAAIVSGVTACLLIYLWYGMPLLLRRRLAGCIR